MNKLKIAKLTALAVGCGLVAAGCEVRVHEPAGAAVITTEPAETDAYVAAPPPAPLDDNVVGAAPGPDFVWIGGNWAWGRDRWEWERGHWEHPPHAGAHWQDGRYEGHHYHRGHWE